MSPHLTILHEAGFDKNMKIIVFQTPQTSSWLARLRFIRLRQLEFWVLWGCLATREPQLHHCALHVSLNAVPGHFMSLGVWRRDIPSSSHWVWHPGRSDSSLILSKVSDDFWEISYSNLGHLPSHFKALYPNTTDNSIQSACTSLGGSPCSFDGQGHSLSARDLSCSLDMFRGRKIVSKIRRIHIRNQGPDRISTLSEEEIKVQVQYPWDQTVI